MIAGRMARSAALSSKATSGWYENGEQVALVTPRSLGLGVLVRRINEFPLARLQPGEA